MRILLHWGFSREWPSPNSLGPMGHCVFSGLFFGSGVIALNT